MTVEEVKELCILYEQLKTGNRNCKNINKVFKTISVEKQMTKNKKIEKIKRAFETIADETIAQYLINKQFTGDTNNQIGTSN